MRSLNMHNNFFRSPKSKFIFYQPAFNHNSVFNTKEMLYISMARNFDRWYNLRRLLYKRDLRGERYLALCRASNSSALYAEKSLTTRNLMRFTVMQTTINVSHAKHILVFYDLYVIYFGVSIR